MTTKTQASGGLYRPEFERDNCGFGLIAQMDNKASNKLVHTAIESLSRLTHRGAVAADGKSGDGCGLLLKKPDQFLRQVATELSLSLNDQYATGMVFLNHDKNLQQTAKQTLEEALQQQGLSTAGWRAVPLNTEACGQQSLDSLPAIWQIFVNAPDGLSDTDFERQLYISRRIAEKKLTDDPVFYVPSLSCNLISYKGLVLPKLLSQLYLDLGDERFTSSLCVYHQRFSTNTLPQWRLAQPFRMIAHNGEINTIQGNRNWALARSMKFKSELIEDMSAIQPWVSRSGSDSSSMDNMVEAMLACGMDIFRAMRLLIPPAWQNVSHLDPELRAFYEYYSMHMEPWDGPAGVVLTDGRYAACCMDRNGLRPARYVITKDRHITLASEIGVYDYDPADVVKLGRLGPGQMMAVDTLTGELLLSDDVDNRLKQRQPYQQWLQDNHNRMSAQLNSEECDYPEIGTEQISVYQKLFQVSFEERDQVLKALAENAQEATGSMGDDTPFPVLSTLSRSLYDYFRQQFAQVTNPPIDPLRETVVMSLNTCLGRELNIFEESADHASRLGIDSPVLTPSQLQQIRELKDPDYRHHIIELGYTPETHSLQTAIEHICDQAVKAVRDGTVILILSDYKISPDSLNIHALLATGAIHHRLIREGLRCDANLIIETGTARDSHQIATLLGYGATAVYPYLAVEVLRDMLRTGEINSQQHDCNTLAKHYYKGINKGLLKILSKMGISSVASYRGAQLFEAVGLHEDVVKLCFTDTTCRISGSTFNDLENEAKQLKRTAWQRHQRISQGGLLKYIHGGEYHAYNPDVVSTLRQAVQTGDYQTYKRYADLVNQRPVATLRDLLKLRDDVPAIPLNEVESIEHILPRFDSAGMSLGALSPEAHESLAIAMNRLGGRSNSGEGGEDIKRYNSEKVSKIKQIASGRFGVTPSYLVNAEVLQIKIAQGAKPGEGGQLPGKKVDQYIGKLRFATPGTTLISPPPHHDIYSIEDLAQLIFDLKQVNPNALVSVKLVAEAGVGTIAAGVAKAYADLITISGYDGGTGASPLTSVKYAGSPWELGLSETHQILRANDLRSKVILQTDGGLKTGLDVIKAAILGAESFGFGTGPMVALGCKYLRICHLNTCAVGIATQNKTLRSEHFIGLPDMVMNYFRFIAEETREWMATVGVKSLDALIGRTDLLSKLPGNTDKQQHLDLSPILSDGGVSSDKPHNCQVERNEPFDKGLFAEKMVNDCLTAIENKSGGIFHYRVKNTYRSIGARLSGEIAKRHGNQGMSHAPLTLHLKGTAGQSFGVWNAGGLNMKLEGDANDYVGKGMAGGKLSLQPPTGASFETQTTPIMGNTCLYGATGGELFAAGCAGERFAVRNSGCHAIIEGVGDHGCEYMTGGLVIVLGKTGINFGAGMSGGMSFVLDVDRSFVDCYNHEMIDIHRIDTEQMVAYQQFLKERIREFVEETQSSWGHHILTEFNCYVRQFWLIKPKAADLETLIGGYMTV